jgi:AAA family ATP:ADP antiporter
MTSVRPLLVAACALASVAHGSFVGGSARSSLKVRPSLPAARFALMQAEAVVPPDDQSAAAGPLAKLKQSMPPAKELKKVLPLGLMFFFILFSYTILRDTKDVLVVTAPKSGAEIIPFLKTYVNLPGAIGFTVLYSSLTNKFSREQVFTGIVGTFVAFFLLFAAVIYPNQALLHPTALVDSLAALLPAGFSAPLAIIRNWTYALFYTMAELWGSVVVSLLFWGFANEVTKVEEAKKYYPLFGLGANVALIFSGQYVRFVSSLRRSSTAADPWGTSLKLLMGAVAASGCMVLALFRFMQTKVMTDPECVPPQALKKTKTKTKMSLKESAQYLASSAYIRNLAALVICYGMSINIVEVSWKAKLKQAFPNPNDYSEFMGSFSSATGAVTLGMMLLGQRIFKVFGWGVAALITPTLLFATGATFFALTLFSARLSPLVAALGTTPLMLAVIVGACQNILSKSAKYSLFDPCKEMAYIPLDPESKTKGKAAVDVIGNPLGKSGGSFIQQFMIFGFGSLAASTPYLAAVLGLIIVAWIRSAQSLSGLFAEAMEKEGLEEA